jgi:hypothetical protein
MASIDIALPDELMAALTPPVCLDLQLPSVSATLPSVTLPIGGPIQAVADFTKGIPTDCAMNFSLLLQLGPIMANMQCLLKILNFVTTVIGIIKDINLNPVQLVAGIATAIPKIVNAAEGLTDCLNLALPLIAEACFIKSVLELIAKMLLCAVQALESILNVFAGLEAELSAALAAGNEDLVAALQCAQTNANTSAAATIQSLQPIMVLLALAQPILELFNIELEIELPSAIDTSDLAAAQNVLTTIGEVAQTIKTIADAIPCPTS